MRRIAMISLPILALVCFVAASASSQALPTGTMLAMDPIGPCSGVRNGAGFGQNMTCAGMSVSCPNTQALTGIYGWYVPANPVGTIVLFSGGKGTTPSENFDEDATYANDYEAKGYTVVQLEWDSPWEDPSNGSGGSILTAACRPATFLSWVSTHLLQSGTAMCAQGSSAGSAAIAYSLTWYGAASYLTNVELLSGPVLSKIDLGCTYPNALNMDICATNPITGKKQYGCTNGTNNWFDNVIYVSYYSGDVSAWTGLSGCALASGQGNLPTWQTMGIVDGSATGASPVFNYPSTSMHGWACAAYSSCTAPHCPNNSASQGNYYYEQFSSSQTPKSFALSGVLACDQEEGVSQGTDPDTGAHPEYGVIEKDMEAQCVLPQ